MSGPLAVVAKGLAAGERVVTDGQLRLSPGAKVEIKPAPARGALMNIAELFIRRPVMTTLVMLGILLFGVMGYRLLPISDLPNVDFPTIQVTAALPGASPGDRWPPRSRPRSSGSSRRSPASTR